jgi:tartrate-resistant acid phosphatase type 5
MLTVVLVLLALAAGFGLGARAALRGGKKLHRKGYYPLLRDLVPIRVEPRTPGRLRFLALGDVGTGDADQARVAATMRRLCAEQPQDFVVFLGDTFYETGLSGPDDPLFERLFESQYGRLGVPCFGIAGNHDVKRDALPLVLCTLRSRTWRMPNFHYAFTVPPSASGGAPIARFFLLNTNLNLLELMRLRRVLKPDAGPWTFVMGHHSLYANGAEGDWDWAGRRYWHRHLGPSADFYVCGHNHQLEHLRVPGLATDYVVSGAGGSHYRAHVVRGARFKSSHAKSLFLHRDNGVAAFDVTAQRVRVSYLDADGRELYAFERTR